MTIVLKQMEVGQWRYPSTTYLILSSFRVQAKRFAKHLTANPVATRVSYLQLPYIVILPDAL